MIKVEYTGNHAEGVEVDGLPGAFCKGAPRDVPDSLANGLVERGDFRKVTVRKEETEKGA